MKKLLSLGFFVIILLIMVAGCSFVNPISVNSKGVFTKQALTANLIVPDSVNPVQVKSVVLHWVLNNAPTFDSIKILESNENDSANFTMLDEKSATKIGTFVDTMNDADFNKTYYFKLQGSDGEELNVFAINFLPYVNIYSPSDTVNSSDFSITWNKITGTITDIHVFLFNGSDTSTVWKKDIVIDDTTAIDTSIIYNSDSTASDSLITGKIYDITVTTSRGDATTIGSKLFYKH